MVSVSFSVAKYMGPDLVQVQDEGGVAVLLVLLTVKEDDLPLGHHNVQLLPSMTPNNIILYTWLNENQGMMTCLMFCLLGVCSQPSRLASVSPISVSVPETAKEK